MSGGARGVSCPTVNGRRSSRPAELAGAMSHHGSQLGRCPRLFTLVIAVTEVGSAMVEAVTCDDASKPTRRNKSGEVRDTLARGLCNTVRSLYRDS